MLSPAVALPPAVSAATALAGRSGGGGPGDRGDCGGGGGRFPADGVEMGGRPF